jgi:antitoxin component YwqK of YwqJK toxin-antitoxin module
MNRTSHLFLRTGIMIIFLFLVTFSGALAQKIDKDTIDGKVFYVYPFPQEVRVHSNFYLAVKRTFRQKRFSYKEYYIAMFGEDYDKREFRRTKRDLKKSSWENRKYKKRNKHFNSAFKKAVRNNPYPLLEQQYTLENDIIPSLDQIPDGEYVQYFTGYYPISKKGKMVTEEKQVAGYFSIKDNMLDGKAVWFNVKGDTLKQGQFSKGLKEGKWTLETRKVSYSLNKEDAKQYVERGYPDIDTSREIVNFKSGFKDGYYAFFQNSANPIQEGYYSNNEPSGIWTERAISYTGKGINRKRNRNNKVVTWTYSPADSVTVVKQTLIRRKLWSEEDYRSAYDFDSKFDPSISLTKLYTINFPKEVDLELEEEKITSYEGEEYEEDYYGEELYVDEGYIGDYGDFEVEDEYYAYRNYVYDPNSGEYKKFSKLIDSLGVSFNFDGVYEKRYPNGQLMVRYEFKDGKLLNEDTIFWDNGKPYDVITFVPDSNHYVQNVYDYNGKLYNSIVYDAKGDFKRMDFQPVKTNYVTIGEFKAEDSEYGQFFFYDKLDTLKYTLNDSLVLFRSWSQEDTSLLYSRSYVPSSRSLYVKSYAISGTPSLEGEIMFSDNFESWTGSKVYRVGDVQLRTTTSASFSQWAEKDSIPQRHVEEFSGDIFDLTEDHVLHVGNKPYTGDFTLITNEDNFEVKSKGSLKITLPRARTMTDKLMKEAARYKKTGRSKYKDLFHTIDALEISEDFGGTIYNSLFGGLIGIHVEYPYSEYYEYEMEEGEQKYNEKKDLPLAKRFEGYFKDGKPQGNWKVYDQFGKLMYEIPFEKGNVHGTLKEYNDAYPNEEVDLFNEQNEYLEDSIPPKKKHYLYSTMEYKNGLENGEYNRYNWLGELNEQVMYKDGLKDGKAFERNNLAYTSLNYKEGALDGYVRTYLTLKGQDSLLLFDLNFQNGMLQGESRSYHTNGKLAKKGFFLNGESIDDYEAYDSLGFRYHYVKFMYGFPIEEKIWEENELSVRYLFDWRDSIYFQPTDITSSQSLDRVLAQLGIGRDYYNRPYYGRPSLVRKEGVDYSITKYYPNDTIARDGSISSGKKVGCWKYYSYEGEFLYEADYFDTIIKVNDTIQFKAKGLLTDYNKLGQKISESYIIEKFEKYDCSHTDHYEIRQLMTIWQGKDSVDRMNGYVKNYYDNGVLQNEGQMKDGLPTGVWKFYDPYGKLNQVGAYVMGKRDGRWLAGDLSKTKYLGDICLNPNLPDLEEEIKYREKLLDIIITNYRLGKALNKEFYDVNMNDFEEENSEGEDVIFEGE